MVYTLSPQKWNDFSEVNSELSEVEGKEGKRDRNSRCRSYSPPELIEIGRKEGRRREREKEEGRKRGIGFMTATSQVLARIYF
jgi:hypothetical protein